MTHTKLHLHTVKHDIIVFDTNIVLKAFLDMHIYYTMPKLSVNMRCFLWYLETIYARKKWNSSHNYLLFLHLSSILTWISFTKSTFLRCLLCAINDTCSSIEAIKCFLWTIKILFYTKTNHRINEFKLTA